MLEVNSFWMMEIHKGKRDGNKQNYELYFTLAEAEAQISLISPT